MVLIRQIVSTCCWLGLICASIAPAQAHDPFDGSTQIIVFDNKIEAKVTLGYDAARTFLRAAKLPPGEAGRLTRVSHDGKLVRLPLALAAQLLTLRSEGRAVDATAFLVAPDDNEINFLLIYPRPAAAVLEADAVYFQHIDYMRAGALVAANTDRDVLVRAIVSKSFPSVTVPLLLSAASNPAGLTQTGFAAFFKLGVEHILSGFDHLLFLCALLLTVRRMRVMLGIISAFTLAHSITLALAAFDLVVVRPSIVEPLIAASIIVVCVENFLRREAATDRYWMAAGFGLIHGFGFAGILRDTAMVQPGAGIILPLLSFNLGVETGQLMVAAVFIPMLMLARRKALFTRYGAPALSTVVILVSSVWLLQRLIMV